ncbi:MAG: hypothetical protein SNJ84_07000 [Verrucomicrobiia bacterium]
MNAASESGNPTRWQEGLVVAGTGVALVATMLSYVGLVWWWGPVEGMSLVRWSSFGQGDYEPMAARVTVMAGREGEEGGEFAAWRLDGEAWRKLPGTGRILTWQAVAEAPLRGGGSVVWLWDRSGRPGSVLIDLGVWPGASSAAVMVEDRVMGRKWLFEWEGDGR